MAPFDGVVLGSFVARVRGIRFSDFGVSGARTCRGESVLFSYLLLVIKIFIDFYY